LVGPAPPPAGLLAGEGCGVTDQQHAAMVPRKLGFWRWLWLGILAAHDTSHDAPRGY